MKSTGTPMTMEQQLREMNEALLISSVRQHELTEQAQKAEAALQQTYAELRAHAEELDRFNRLAVGRELRMIELKKEVDEVCQRYGEAARYPLEFDKQVGIQESGMAEQPPPTMRPSDSIIPLESVLCTEELARRPSRPPDYRSENHALVTLGQALADSPSTILQTLAENILEVLKADSAGVSLLTKDKMRFYWPAIAGIWKPHIGGGTPRDFGPCGDVLDRNSPLLFRHFERRYAYFLPVTPPVEECLLVPFYVEGKAVGTIWAIAHDERRKFDAEDLRQLESLGRFASAAYQTVELLQGQDSRHGAALNLMEDALRSRQAMETLNQQLRDSQTRFEAMFDTSPVGMYLVDAELRIRLTSRTARPVFGDIGELIGRDFVEVIHILWPPESADEIVARFRHTLETGEPHIAIEFSEVRYDRKVRECYDWQIHRINLPDGQYGVVCYFIDVSKRMQLSDDLRQYAANMFDADRRKNEFLAMLAHELRNPLAPISNALQIMRLAPGDRQSVHEATEMMERQVGEMVRLVDDLLDVNRISRGTIELRRGRVELASVLRHAVEASRSAMESAEQALTITLPPQPIYLNADPTRLAQVMGNLLNNANKYTDNGGRIELVVSVEWQVVSEEKKGEFRDDRAALSRALGMANGDELSRAVLPRDEALPHGRTVRPDQPDSTSSSIDTGQHRRGPGAAAHKGIPEPSEHRAGIAHGGGNALTANSAGGLAKSNDTGLAPEDVGRNQSNALWASAGAGSEALKLATQHSPLATPFAVIRVRDNGIGIAAGELARIFEMFAQVDTSLKRSAGGLGIGLSLVKNLVEMHDGTVAVHSAGVGQGSEFVVRLPIETLESSPPPPPQPTLSEPTTAMSRRILVVDDNRISADSLAKLLELTGNETQSAYDGLEAVAAAATFRPDVILLDIGLPKLNGYEAARRIREQPWGKNIVIVALTGWGQNEDRQKSKAAGFNGHMVKPVELDALMKLLAELQPTAGSDG